MKKQVIIATHSATIVTNTMAEQVVVMDSDNKHGWIDTYGYPETPKVVEKIVNLLEGGAASFAHKSIIYEEYLNEM